MTIAKRKHGQSVTVVFDTMSLFLIKAFQCSATYAMKQSFFGLEIKITAKERKKKKKHIVRKHQYNDEVPKSGARKWYYYCNTFNDFIVCDSNVMVRLWTLYILRRGNHHCNEERLYILLSVKDVRSQGGVFRCGCPKLLLQNT